MSEQIAPQPHVNGPVEGYIADDWAMRDPKDNFGHGDREMGMINAGLRLQGKEELDPVGGRLVETDSEPDSTERDQADDTERLLSTGFAVVDSSDVSVDFVPGELPDTSSVDWFNPTARPSWIDQGSVPSNLADTRESSTPATLPLPQAGPPGANR